MMNRHIIIGFQLFLFLGIGTLHARGEVADTLSAEVTETLNAKRTTVGNVEFTTVCMEATDIAELGLDFKRRRMRFVGLAEIGETNE